MQANHLIVLDEADDLLYKKPEDFFAFASNKAGTKFVNKRNPKVICLTATKGTANDLWHELLAFYNFSELSYWPTGIPIPPGIITTLQSTDCTTIAPSQMQDTLLQYNANRAIIIFTDSPITEYKAMGLANLHAVTSLDCK